MAFKQRSRKILTPSSTVAKQYPWWGKGEPLYFWAERGLVCWEDARTNGYGTLSIKEACERVLALSQMIINSSEDRRWQTERVETQRFITNMEHVIRMARDQGSPDAPDAGADHRRRRAKSVSVARAVDRVVVGDPADSYNL